MTTPFRPNGSVDEALLGEHVDWLIASGCRGIVALGSLGEGSTLQDPEKRRILRVCLDAARGRVPVVAAISGLATQECVQLARAAAGIGCDGLMVLPAYVYRGDERETQAHFSAVIEATPLSCILYNNPIAYGTDLTVRDIEVLAERHHNVHAVKESSGDVRRLTALRARLDGRLALFAGLDDMVTEATLMGGDGWVAGLVNAFPEESVRLFDLAQGGHVQAARRLYDWFLPLLRFDTLPKFVQLIKLAQAEVGRGSEAVRPPRLPLCGEERTEALGLIRARMQELPRLQAPAAANA